MNSEKQDSLTKSTKFVRRIGWGILLALIVISSGCIQKRFSLEGRLLALASKTPLKQVALRVMNIATKETLLAETDDDGKFIVDRLLAGTYRISSADSLKVLVSPDTVIISPNAAKLVHADTLRGMIPPPQPGVYAWVKNDWREVSVYRTLDGGSSILREVANQLVTVSESASLVVYFPGHEWGTATNGVDWLAGTFADSIVRFASATLREKVGPEEPEPMNPLTFTNWNYPGVYPLRGPSTPNLYAIEVTTTLPSGVIDRALYPFWVPMSGHNTAQVQQPASISSMGTLLGGNINPFQGQLPGVGQNPRIDTLPAATRDLFQQALTAALGAIGLRPQTAGQPGTGNLQPNLGDTTNAVDMLKGQMQPTDRINQWRLMVRNEKNDPDTARRRQIWRAIRDSADGTDVGFEADRLLMRDMNNLKLK